MIFRNKFEGIGVSQKICYREAGSVQDHCCEWYVQIAAERLDVEGLNSSVEIFKDSKLFCFILPSSAAK